MPQTDTDAQIKRRALREVGDLGASPLWEVALPQSTTGGSWTLSFGGQPTAPLHGLIERDALQNALESLSSIGAGNVEVVGIPRGPFRIGFVGTLGGQSLPANVYPLTADGSGILPLAQLAPVQLEAGSAPVLSGVADELLPDMGYPTRSDLRFLSLKLALIDTLLGQSHKGVDVETAQRVEKLAQQNDHLVELRELTWQEWNRVLTFNTTADQSTTPVASVMLKKTPNGLPYGQLPRVFGRRIF